MQKPPDLTIQNKSAAVKKSVPAKGVIVLLSILFGISLLVTLVSLPLKASLFNQEFFLQRFESQDLYQNLPSLIVESIHEKLSANEKDAFISNLSRGDLENLVMILIPDGWLELQTQVALWSVLDFVNLNSDDIFYLVDLKPLKQNLDTPQAQQAIVSMITGLPECSGDQMNLIVAAIQLGQGGFTFCNPPVSDLPVVDFLLTPVTNEIRSRIPDAIQIPSDTGRQYLQAFRSSVAYGWYWYFRKSLEFLPWVNLSLGLLIFLFSLRRVKWMMTGLGIPLVITGFLSSIPWFWLLINSNNLANQLVTISGFSEMQHSAQVIFRIAQDILVAVSKVALVYTVAALFMGLLLLAIGLLIKKSD